MKGALARLDRIIEHAVAAPRSGPEAEGSAAYRGLFVTDADVRELLGRGPMASPLFGAPRNERSLGARAEQVQARLGLSNFEMDVVLVALAPEVDLRYERLYGYLQDDVTKKRPTIDLALNLLCASAEEKLAQRSIFDPEAPLVQLGVIRLESERGAAELAATLRVAPTLIRFLLRNQAGRAPQAACAVLDEQPRASPLHLERAVESLARLRARSTHESVVLHLNGPPSCGQEDFVETLAFLAERPLLCADARLFPSDLDAFVQALRTLRLEARLRRALLYVAAFDTLTPWQALQLVSALCEPDPLTILDGGALPESVLASSLCVLDVTLPSPEFAPRYALWQRELARRGAVVPADAVESLAARYRLTASQIRAVCHEVMEPTPAVLAAAARERAARGLHGLAERIETCRGWDDLVVPASTKAQLQELCTRVERRRRVLAGWNFGGKLSRGFGTAALFAGPSGTGKTLASEVIANALGLVLYRVDLSLVISKWVGETEKNLARVFDAASRSSAVLLFDEAESLFGQRSTVRDSHDRYANIEVSYLLQKMEQYDGVAILATNLAQQLDEAFVRRLAFTVHFSYPDVTLRRQLWTSVWPAQAPISPECDFDVLAKRFALSGGNIKNIAVAAAYLVADDEQVIEMRHLRVAIRREYQKLGKVLSEQELECGSPTLAMPGAA